jgi:small subunit ribosomal protein S17
MPKRKLKGTVVSNKMEKTIIVAVDKFKEHPKYKKRYKSTRRYKVNVKNAQEFKIGDKVMIEETKPMSKEKRWKIIQKISGSLKEDHNEKITEEKEGKS